MNEKDLAKRNKVLRRAAKAAGYEVDEDFCRTDERVRGCPTPWRPLEDDGDAFRLSVKLGMQVIVDYAKLVVNVWNGVDTWIQEDLSIDGVTVNKDPAQVTRTAIVMAAAAYGAKLTKAEVVGRTGGRQ